MQAYLEGFRLRHNWTRVFVERICILEDEFHILTPARCCGILMSWYFSLRTSLVAIWKEKGATYQDVIEAHRSLDDGIVLWIQNSVRQFHEVISQAVSTVAR
jgi:hypothetical protein